MTLSSSPTEGYTACQLPALLNVTQLWDHQRGMLTLLTINKPSSIAADSGLFDTEAQLCQALNNL